MQRTAAEWLRSKALRRISLGRCCVISAQRETAIALQNQPGRCPVTNRELGDSWRDDIQRFRSIKERLDFVGVRVIFVSQGFDSSAPQSQTLLTVHGLVDGLYLDGLREKTFRGVEWLALQ